MKLTIAIIQHSPVFLDLAASLEKAAILTAEAASKGAQLVVFGETWLCGYPSWLDHSPNMALWDHPPTKRVFARMHQNGVEVPGAATERLGKMAKENGVYLVIGVNEVVRKGHSNGTIYNSLLTFTAQGELAIHHRKLMPTFTEKLLYGLGDGHGLKTLETPFGQLGGLICWEHFMPLTRQALHMAGEHIHVAVWPMVLERHQMASMHYAFEGRCFVVAAGQILRVKDIPGELELKDDVKDIPGHLLLTGGSCVIGPDGKFILEPQQEIEDILLVEIPDMGSVYEERMTLDVSGHYNRPDIFDFNVKRERL